MVNETEKVNSLKQLHLQFKVLHCLCTKCNLCDLVEYLEKWLFVGEKKLVLSIFVFPVPPNTSLEVSDNTRVAVCRAERGKPAANISWSHKGNNSTYMIEEPNGFVTVESHLNLTEDMFTDNLTCIIRHLFWNESKSLTLQLNQTNDASTTSTLTSL